jgi:hypothetical protein
LPHVPQLPRSVIGSTHIGGIPHIIPPVMDVHGTHLPATQADPLAQAIPQPPQLAWSVAGSEQTAVFPLPHICWPARHAQTPF